ncbi:Protein LYK5 [Ananas comosus]|uniref:Protein LYK5 n=1 Tax=Ananas comosus TaxID=4615 RepID=A0A199W3E2_ANACO|nr:Protein LYK5 [Ananas comosus]
MLLTYLIIPFSILQCVSSKQIYDPKPCAYNGLSPVSRYTCNSSKSCETYIVYRSQQGFETVREISALFGVNQDQILLDNNITDPTKILETNCEVLIRVECHCLGSFFQSNASYSILKGGTYKIIACDIFEGLVKEQTLAKENSFDAANLKSSTPSCLSPDLVAGVAKYSLISYSFGELTEATKGFSEETELGAYVHKGRIGDRDVVVKKMSSFDAQRIISVYSKINHTNIISLQGVCYGVTDPSSPTSLSTSSYLVFEFARNGSLRDCLRSHSEVLPWDRRIQIAFDVATALHYIHHCTVTSYIHMNISSENILITKDWRAKIANLGVGTSDGSVSTKVDVFGFGLVLLELLCSEEVGDGIHVREKLRVLNEKGSDQNGCFEELREFMDQSLEDYPIEEALCMVVLAMACLEDETTNRPSMHDILKIIARIAR